MQHIEEKNNLIKINGGRFAGTAGMAIGLSIITQKPCRIFGADEAGKELKKEDFIIANAMARLCGGRLETKETAKGEITFYPDEIFEEHFTLSVPAATDCAHLLEVFVLPLAFRQKQITIHLKGGASDIISSSTFCYFQFVFLKTMEKIGVKAEVNLLKRGYYPAGGAEIELKILAAAPAVINLKSRGVLKKITIFSGASESLKSKKTAERQARAAKDILKKLNLPLEEKIEYSPTFSPGSYICLVAEFEKTVIGKDYLAKMGERAEEIGAATAIGLLKEAKNSAAIDEYMGKRILPYLAAAKKSAMAIAATPETAQNCHLIEQFIAGRFEIKENIVKWNSSAF